MPLNVVIQDKYYNDLIEKEIISFSSYLGFCRQIILPKCGLFCLCIVGFLRPCFPLRYSFNCTVYHYKLVCMGATFEVLLLRGTMSAWFKFVKERMIKFVMSLPKGLYDLVKAVGKWCKTLSVSNFISSITYFVTRYSEIVIWERNIAIYSMLYRPITYQNEPLHFPRSTVCNVIYIDILGWHITLPNQKHV